MTQHNNTESEHSTEQLSEQISEQTTQATKQTINDVFHENSTKHSVTEDALAMFLGTCIISFALLLIKQANLVTGGVTGLALLVHYITGLSMGGVLFVLNIPFFVLAYVKLGKAMVIKTFIAISMLSVMVEKLHPNFISIADLDPLYVSVFANALVGVGFVILFRHRSSLGGFGLLGMYAQEYLNIPAGRVATVLDAFVIGASFIFVDWKIVLISVFGAFILNSLLTLNYRDDRYMGH